MLLLGMGKYELGRGLLGSDRQRSCGVVPLPGNGSSSSAAGPDGSTEIWMGVTDQ